MVSSNSAALSEKLRDESSGRLLSTPPPARSRNLTLMYILSCEFCERMAYYGFQGSLVLFLTKRLRLTSAAADLQASLWAGACYLSPLLGGWLADARSGRYQSIMGFMGVYMVGLALVAVAAQPALTHAALFFPALYIVALGTGGIKPNVSTFGADQFDDNNPDDRQAKASFFNYFYFSINLGALLSHTVIAYLCQNVSFAVGYSVPAGAMVVAILLFWLGRHRYKRLPPQGSVLGRFFSIIWEAAWRNRRTQTPHWLDRASQAHGGRFAEADVHDAKLVTRLTPFLLLLIVYWAIYSQMSTTFFNQGCQMDLSLGNFTVPVSALSLFNTAIIIMLIPLVDKVIFPALQRCGVQITMLRKIGAGFLLSIGAMIVAGVIEMRRLEMFRRGEVVGESVCTDDDPGQAVAMSVFAQVPQFMFIGASEVLASVTALEFFYTQAPASMRSVCAALNLVTTAFGQWFAAALIAVVNSNPDAKWIEHDANQGHLDRFFFLMAGLMGLNLLMFVLVARGYVYQKLDTADADADHDDRALLHAQEVSEA